MVEIDDLVWSTSRERAAEDGANWSLRMRFVPDGFDAGRALDVLRAVVREEGAQYDELLSPPGFEPPSFGEWDLARESAAVIVYVTECEVFTEALRAVAASLDRREIGGSFSVWEPPPARRAPVRAPMLVCRVSVRGQRVHRGPRSYLWESDADAHRVVVSAAESWCRSGAESATLSDSLGAPVATDPDEALADRMSAAHARGILARLTAFRGGQFRAICLDPGSGRASLVVGTDATPAGWWREPLEELVSFLRTRSDELVYAHVRRGWILDQALHSGRQVDDWPPRPQAQPWGRGQTRVAFDDVLAPDAFGVQLLGPGFADRERVVGQWSAETMAGGAVLVRANDLEAWFGASFVSGGPGEPAADLAVLERARVVLAPILCSSESLRRLGYGDATWGS